MVEDANNECVAAMLGIECLNPSEHRCFKNIGISGEYARFPSCILHFGGVGKTFDGLGNTSQAWKYFPVPLRQCLPHVREVGFMIGFLTKKQQLPHVHTVLSAQEDSPVWLCYHGWCYFSLYDENNKMPSEFLNSVHF